MADIQTISIVLAAIGICIAAVNSIYSSREAKRQRRVEIETRQAELYMQVCQRFNTTEMRRSLQNVLYVQNWENLSDWYQKYGNQSDAWVAGTQLGSYFAAIGVFIEQGLLDPALIDDLMGEYIVDYWEKMVPLVTEMRKINPRQGDKIEYLYNVIKQRHPTGLGFRPLAS